MTLSQDAEAPASEVVLEAEGLTKHFPVRRGLRELVSRHRDAVHAVDDVHLTLRRGRVTALVGESGSGKSTVARLLAQLYPRTAGDIRLHGASTRVKGGRRLGVLAQRHWLFLTRGIGTRRWCHSPAPARPPGAGEWSRRISWSRASGAG